MTKESPALFSDVPRGSGALTREALEESFEAIENAPLDPCLLGRHVASATALREEWQYARCGNCGGVVKLR